MSFLLKLILAVGIGAAIFFLITGGTPDGFPEPTEEGFKIEVEASSTVGEWKKKVKDFFGGNSTSTSAETGNEEEADVEFFKKLIPDKEGGKEESAQEGEQSENKKGFLENLIDKFKEQFDKSEENKSAEVFSSKVSNVPSFTTVCFPEVKQACSPAGCKKDSPQVEFTLLDKEKSLIAHCDAEGCVTYEAEYEKNDGYENYQPLKPKGYIISKQIESDDGHPAYIEAVTKGVEIIMYSGYCLERE